MDLLSLVFTPRLESTRRLAAGPLPPRVPALAKEATRDRLTSHRLALRVHCDGVELQRAPRRDPAASLLHAHEHRRGMHDEVVVCRGRLARAIGDLHLEGEALRLRRLDAARGVHVDATVFSETGRAGGERAPLRVGIRGLEGVLVEARGRGHVGATQERPAHVRSRDGCSEEIVAADVECRGVAGVQDVGRTLEVDPKRGLPELRDPNRGLPDALLGALIGRRTNDLDGVSPERRGER